MNACKMLGVILLASSVGCRIAENASSEPAAIAGRVVNGWDGRPVARADVQVRLGGDEERTVTAVAGASGVFIIEGLHEGTHDIAIEVGDRAALRSVDLRGGAWAEIGDVPLHRPVRVEGRLVGPGGDPLAGRKVYCLTDVTARDRIHGFVQVFEAVPTDPDGRFGFLDRYGRRAAIILEEENTRPRVFRLDLPDGGRVDVTLRETEGEVLAADAGVKDLFP
jgi:hypothetical protein